MTDYRKLYDYLSDRADEQELYAKVACECNGDTAGHFDAQVALASAQLRVSIYLGNQDPHILLILAQAYKDRSDFDPEWSLQSHTYVVEEPAPDPVITTEPRIVSVDEAREDYRLF